ncbi:unnamed protein product [Macrosiphum euphorbiae]|uniref:Uncharacterized protein n=1 Tax=Macrosiphum euphorbiae TaxID=13131 RepID=A0AAV0Y7J2_9HEMI|nr:unnamed protein product [Macrosiphum euphorbiae]
MYAYHLIGIEENIVVETSENIVREESENADILVVAIPQMPGEEYDRCFVWRNTVVAITVVGMKTLDRLTFFCHAAMDGVVIIVVNNKPTVEFARHQ